MSSTQLRNKSFDVQIIKNARVEVTLIPHRLWRRQSTTVILTTLLSQIITFHPGISFYFRRKVLVIHRGEFNNIKELSFVSRCRRLIWIAMFRRLISNSLLQAMRSTYSASPYEARCSALIGWFSTAVTGASLYFILSFKLDVVDSRFELSKHEPISFFCPQLLWKLWQYPLEPF